MFMRLVENIALFFYTVLVWVVTAFAFILHFLLTLITYPFAKEKEAFAQDLTQPFFTLGFFLFRFRMKVFGHEHIPADKHFILISNHQSLLDIVVLFKVFRHSHIVFIAKKELLNVPILGWDIRMLGHVAIDRSNPKTSLIELAKVEKRIEEKLSVVLFPEGTRSLDGTLGEFKKGAFMMAAHTGVSLLPCCIMGTGKILNKRSFMMRPGHITVKIGEPIPIKKAENKPEAKQIAEEARVKAEASIRALMAAS
jgi:1-acyl-sn-glycerol-3-phosphate acyltransferase